MKFPYYYYFNRNPRRNVEEPLSKSARAYAKKYLTLERFFNELSITTLREVADTWVDPSLTRLKSKSKLINLLLEDENIVRNALKSARDDGTILYTLKYLATEDEIEQLLIMLNIEHKSNDTLTRKAILESLRLIVTAPLADVADYRQEAIRFRKGRALSKARDVRSKQAAKTKRKADRLAAKEKREKEKIKVAKQKAAARKAAKEKREKEKIKAARKRAAAREAAKEKKSRALARAETRKQPALKTVIDFLIEVEKELYFGKKLTMKAYAKEKNIKDYVGFTKKVKAFKAEAARPAHSLFLRWKDSYEEPIYRQHVIDYLAISEFRKAEGVLSRKAYVEEKNLDPKSFAKFFSMFRHQADVQDEANIMYLELEAGRISDLREPPKLDPIEQLLKKAKPLAKVEGYAAPDLILLEKLAKKKLPVRKGLPVFNKDPRENNLRMEMWLDIAEDVMTIGLQSVIAEKYLHKFNLPETLDYDQQIKLILMRIRTVLEQLDVFDPSKEHLTFARLRAWKEGRDAKKIKKAERLAQKVISETQDPEPDLEPMLEDDLYDEEWLIAEIAREEAEARRFLTTDEEKNRRRSEGLVYSETLPRKTIEELKTTGAIYEGGAWLLPDKETLQKLQKEFSTTGLAGWTLRRKPRLLIGIGTQDYTKAWMHHFFDIQTSQTAAGIESGINAFKPDALMIYASSTGSSLYRGISDLARKNALPLIVFDKGFSEAIMSAGKQGLLWFIDAFNKKRTISKSHRYNPYAISKSYRYNPYFQYLGQLFNRRRLMRRNSAAIYRRRLRRYLRR